MTIMTIPLAQLQAFLLVFLRVSAVLMAAPLLDSRNVPLVFKVGLALALSSAVYGVAPVRAAAYEDNLAAFFVGAAGELLLGAAMGLAVKLVFNGVQLAGQLAGFQMGFAIANVMDNVSAAQISIMAQLKNILAMLLFLSINAHHLVLRALAESFELAPVFTVQVSGSLVEHLMRLAGTMFVMGVKVGAPIMVSLLLTSVALGLMARTVPQMNIFIVAFPIKIAIGLLMMGISLPFIAALIQAAYGKMGQSLNALVRLAG